MLNSQGWHYLASKVLMSLFSEISPSIALDWGPLRDSDLFLSFSSVASKPLKYVRSVSQPYSIVFFQHMTKDVPFKLQCVVGIYAVIFEDEKPLGMELEDCIEKKNPNQAQHSHIVYGECCMEYSSFCTTPWLGLRVS